MRIALIAGTKRLAMAELTQVAQAIQKQLVDHVRPVWDIDVAEVRAFPTAGRVPKDYWRATVRDRIRPAGAWSIHSFANGQPFAEITFGEGWTLGASHDLIEMLVDPQVQRIEWGRSIRPGDEHDVAYMVQACDPCALTSYEIDGVKVADFSTPAFWTAAPGTKGKYSYTGSLSEPHEIIRGGYISWKDPKSRHYWQKLWWQGDPTYHDLGPYGADAPPAPQQQRTATPPSIPRGRRQPNELTALWDVRRSQQPAVVDARDRVEQLIRDFGQRSGDR